jgi:NhaP-type Na+/H+ or K+/H+ antiporter
MYQDLAILAIFILVYSSFAGRVERSWLSGAIIFTAFGLLIGPVGLDLISFKADREAIRTLAELALALGCFAVAQWLGGSGFIAAFSGGLLFGVLPKKARDEFLLAAEGTGDTMALITWVIFGAAVVGQAVGHFSGRILLYAVLSLTLIRMVPVFLVLTGMGVSTEGKLFIGWFGPRGLASIVFAVIVVSAGVPNSGTIAATVVCTIILSILAHGITANPWAQGFGKRFRNAKGDASSDDG